MKLAVLLNLLLIVAYSESQSDSLGNAMDNIEESMNETIDPMKLKVTDEVFKLEESTTEEHHVIYWYISKANPSETTAVDRNNLKEKLSSTDFSPSKQTIFLIHDMTYSVDSSVFVNISDAASKKTDANIFVVDWSSLATRHYMVVVFVGKFLGQFIEALVDKTGLPMSNITLVGHLGGSHVAGNAGSHLGGQIPVIVALEPATDYSMVVNGIRRLDVADAKFVQVIYCLGGPLRYFGMVDQMGHAEYYPNGGMIQPGCWTRRCSTDKCGLYYAESLGSDKFVALACPSTLKYLLGYCNKNATSVMGTTQIDTKARGSYYLTTNSNPPFAKGPL